MLKPSSHRATSASAVVHLMTRSATLIAHYHTLSRTQPFSTCRSGCLLKL
jgi:hypothetical protein